MRLPLLPAVFTTLCLSAAPVLAGGLGEMSDAERDAFRDEVRSYLVEHPEVLVEAMNELQSRQEEAAAVADDQLLVTYKRDIFADSHSWVGGNPDGDITVVEFMDYRCSYCRKAYQEVEDLVKSDGNIRLIFKEYPILGEDSVTSSRFAIAVLQLHGDKAYKQAHDALISLRGQPDAATLGRLASEMGFAPKPILEKMNAPEVTAVIAQNQDLGVKMQINGTPTFVVQGAMLRGYVPLDAMRQIVADERKKG